MTDIPRSCLPSSSTASAAKPVDSADGATFAVADPVTNTPYATGRGRRCRRRRPRGGRRPGRAFADGPWPSATAAARQRSEPDRRRRRGPRRAAGGSFESYDTGLPITQARGQARRAAENFRYFADVIVALGEEAFRQPGRAVQLRRAQAGRRGRADHAVEHPVHAGDLEARPGPGLRLHAGPQARRVDPAVGRLWPEIFAEAGVPGGRGQHRPRHRRGGRVQALVDHPDVPLISFTGEPPTRAATSSGRAAAAPEGPSRWSWAASPRPSSSPTPTSKPPSTRSSSACSPSTASVARPVRASLCERPVYEEFVAPSGRAGRATSGSGRPPTRPPRSARWSTPSTTNGSWTTSRSARRRPVSSPVATGPRTCRTATTCQPTVFADVEP